jgi:FG-GAP-like repeat/Cep192 domain 4
MHQQKTFPGSLLVIAAICFAGSPILLHAQKPTVPPVSFAAPVDYTTGTLPFANTVADFNGDGILDVAVVNYSTNNVSVLFGNGDGTFQTQSLYTVGTEPTAIVAADFNGDGVPDIAVADEIGKTIAVLINKADGSGTFLPAVLYPAGNAPRGIASGSLRNNGINDLVVANNLGGNVTVFLGNGDGTFQPGVNYAADVNPKSVALGVFSTNGILDIACANHNTNDVSILMGNGDGTFQPPVNYATGIDPRHVLAYDFNKDGKLDLAIANGGESTVSILYGNGDGTFQAQVKYNVNTSPRWLAVADYNNDGFWDIATSNYDAKNISVILGTGLTASGQGFTTHQDYVVGPNPTGLAAGVFTSNGLPDIAVTVGGLPTAPNTYMAVLLNDPAIVSPTSLTFPLQVLGTASAPQVVTLTNHAPNSLTITNIAFTGTDPGDFSQTNNCGSALSGNASCTINVTFTPKGINNRTASLTVTDNAPGGSQAVAITASSTAASFSPTSLTFASQAVGTTSAPQVITLTDVSGTTMTISSIAITGTNLSDYAETNTCGTSLAGKKSCTISVTFTPTATGTRTAAVTVTDNAGGTSQSVPLTGTGIATVSVTPTSLTFPLQVLNTTSAAQQVTLSNLGTTALSISSMAFSGADATDFAETNNCGTSLAASSSCTINVTFTPKNINHRSATLTITDSAGTQTVTITGTSTAASFSPTSLTFAAQTVGTTSAGQNITLTDVSGSTTITITSLTITGTNATDFAQTNTCGTSVAPKKSCTITVTFTPTATGARSASVSVADNAGLSPQTVPLSGTGK